jgi:hypothetical protein
MGEKFSGKEFALLSQEGSMIETAVEIMRGVVPQFRKEKAILEQHHSVCAIKDAFALFLCCAATSPQLRRGVLVFPHS